MKKQTNQKRTIFLLVVPFIFSLTISVFAQSQATKRLDVAVNGFDFNEAAAKDALGAGADINWQNDAMSGETMLITAIKGFKEAKVIKFLLDNGIDPSIKDETGKTALEWARQYNIGRDRNGREILAMLEAAGAGQKTTNTDKAAIDTKTDGANKTTTTSKPATDKTTINKRSNGVGAPTADEVKETMEKSFTGIYESHFYGVKNKVTFGWAGSIAIGALQSVPSAPKPCYPVKLKVEVTAEDPRDGNRSTVMRGLDSTAGSYKNEIFCFYRDGFGEWDYGTYGK